MYLNNCFFISWKLMHGSILQAGTVFWDILV